MGREYMNAISLKRAVRACGILVIAVFALSLADMTPANADVRPPEGSVTGGTVPGNVKGNLSDSEMWRNVRSGVQGQVSIPNKQAGYTLTR